MRQSERTQHSEDASRQVVSSSRGIDLHMELDKDSPQNQGQLR
jgi:hypothetical protein